MKDGGNGILIMQFPQRNFVNEASEIFLQEHAISFWLIFEVLQIENMHRFGQIKPKLIDPHQKYSCSMRLKS